MSKPNSGKPGVSVILPVHNEADSIEAVVREIYDELAPRVDVRFVICEDGSRDGTKDVLKALAGELPMTLEMSDARKGYSQAVLDGLRLVDTPYFLCLDSDGQCDPKDFWALWERKDDADVVIGNRVDRQDTWQRRTFSRAFRVVFRAFFDVRLNDPSCPFVLGRPDVLECLPMDHPVLDQGFWWEFVARVSGHGMRFVEVPVRHRLRAAGNTKVYTWRTIPGIARTHLAGLSQVRREIKAQRDDTLVPH
jgi:glycosyltransferase involved in cell wall biosynthesis